VSEKKTIDITKPMKRFARKIRLKEKYEGAKAWCQNNPQIVAVAVPIIVGSVVSAVKGGVRSHNIRNQERVKTEYCYDRSLGHYWELRRKLRSDEWIAIDRRRKKGERLADILASLKVLK
jgi:hypothetical protein